jgi:hypothetical protein
MARHTLEIDLVDTVAGRHAGDGAVIVALALAYFLFRRSDGSPIVRSR